MDGEAAAAPPAPPGDGAAWWSLFGALHVNVAVAPVFAFGVMAPSSGRLAGSSPGGTAAIGVAANAGLWLNVVPGYAYDARGPRFATAVGLGLALAGYGATALALAARRAARDATLLRSSRVRIVGPRSAEKSRRAPSSRPHMTPSRRRRRPHSRRATSGRNERSIPAQATRAGAAAAAAGWFAVGHGSAWIYTATLLHNVTNFEVDARGSGRETTIGDATSL